MDNLEDKIGSVLNNPQLMQQIMSMAQSLGQSSLQKQDSPTPTIPESTPDIDLSTIQKLSQLAMQAGIDSNQQALLRALSPYLSHDRVSRLERAMRAAKIARHATSILGTKNLSQLSGR